MLAWLYERIHNKRMDFLHKLSTMYYSSRYDLIFLERLKVANLTRNHRLLARKILDASWSSFKQMLQYKANRIVVEVEPSYTSVDCSRCGNPVPKSLAVRIHVCTKCDAIFERSQCFCQHCPAGIEIPDVTAIAGTAGSYTPV